MELEIGERLGDRRRAAGLSQEELAEKLGVSRQAVSNWERAQSSPDTDNLLALARLYGVTLDELLNGNGSQGGHAGTPAAGLTPRTRLENAIAVVIVAALSVAFYVVAAPTIAMSVMDDATEVFGLTIGTTMALGWIATEIVLVAAPILLFAAVARRTRLNVLFMAATPPAAYVICLAAAAAFNAFAGVPNPAYAGVGGVVATSVVVKADLMGAVLGLTVAYAAWARGPRAAVRDAALAKD